MIQQAQHGAIQKKKKSEFGCPRHVGTAIHVVNVLSFAKK